MQDIINSFYDIIKQIEQHTKYQIHIIAFDFDCTLIPFHTTGCYTINYKNGLIDPTIMKQFFPHPSLITAFIYGLIEKGLIPAVISHSDQRFNNTNTEGVVGGTNLIIPLLHELFKGDNIFDKNNVIAFSNPDDGTFTHKNVHIRKLVSNLNKCYGTNYVTENVLLIDDTINNIKRLDRFQSIFSNFRGSGLSFGCDIDMIKIYVKMLREQVNIQIRDNYGFTINSNINSNANMENEMQVKNDQINNKYPLVDTKLMKIENEYFACDSTWLIVMGGLVLVYSANKIMTNMYTKN